MPRGPKGEKRPADTNSCAVMVAKIATGEEEDDMPHAGKRKAGVAGGAKRSEALSPERRADIAREGALRRKK